MPPPRFCRNSPNDQPASADSGATTKVCPRCQAVFECRGTGCWCNQVQLSLATLDRLARTYHDCLCPSCLAECSG